MRRDGCTVELFPGVTRDISADNLVRDDTDVRQLMVEGEVLRLWFADRYDGEWVLSLLEAAPEDEGGACAGAAARGSALAGPARPRHAARSPAGRAGVLT